MSTGKAPKSEISDEDIVGQLQDSLKTRPSPESPRKTSRKRSISPSSQPPASFVSLFASVISEDFENGSNRKRRRTISGSGKAKRDLPALLPRPSMNQVDSPYLVGPDGEPSMIDEECAAMSTNEWTTLISKIWPTLGPEIHEIERSIMSHEFERHTQLPQPPNQQAAAPKVKTDLVRDRLLRHRQIDRTAASDPKYVGELVGSEIPESIYEVAREVLALPRSHKNMPSRNNLRFKESPNIREHFNRSGFLIPTSDLNFWRRDLRLFSEEQWLFLLRSDWERRLRAGFPEN